MSQTRHVNSWRRRDWEASIKSTRSDTMSSSIEHVSHSWRRRDWEASIKSTASDTMTSSIEHVSHSWRRNNVVNYSCSPLRHPRRQLIITRYSEMILVNPLNPSSTARRLTGNTQSTQNVCSWQVNTPLCVQEPVIPSLPLQQYCNTAIVRFEILKLIFLSLTSDLKNSFSNAHSRYEYLCRVSFKSLH